MINKDRDLKDGNLNLKMHETNPEIETKLPEFLRDLQKKTKDTWTERLSPEAIRKLFSTTQFGRIWMIFQVSNMLSIQIDISLGIQLMMNSLNLIQRFSI